MAADERMLDESYEPAPADRLDALYRRHFAELVGFCRAFVRDRATAEDAAQEAFLRAYRYMGSLNTSRPAWPWLKAIARNVIAARARTAGRESPMEEIRGRAIDPQTEDAIAVGQAWSSLSPRHRLALRLRYVEGWDAETAAATLGIDANALNQLVFRARGRLRGELQRLTEVAPGIAAAPVAWVRARIHAFHSRLSRSSDPAVSRSGDVALQILGGLAVALLTTGLIVSGDGRRADAGAHPEVSPAEQAAPVVHPEDGEAPRPRILPSGEPDAGSGSDRASKTDPGKRDLVGGISRTVEDAPRHASPDLRLIPSRGTADIVRLPSRVDPCSAVPACNTDLPTDDLPLLSKIDR